MSVTLCGVTRLRRPAGGCGRIAGCGGSRGGAEEALLARAKLVWQDFAGFGIARGDDSCVPDVTDAGDDLVELFDGLVVRSFECPREHGGVEVGERLRRAAAEIGAQACLEIHEHIECAMYGDAASANVAFFGTLAAR